jgi:hypothetical protein
MNEHRSSDPLDHLLAREDAPPPAGLEQRLRAATLGYVRRRRRVRRALQAGVASAVVLAAAAIVWLVGQTQTAEQPQQAIVPLPHQERREVLSGDPAPPAPAVTALSLEWQAFDSQADRAGHYFRAGDQYLEVEGDYAGALRCYQQALASSGPGDLEFSTNDNWLVLALKHARLEEMRQ